jgi:hypothetical protein
MKRSYFVLKSPHDLPTGPYVLITGHGGRYIDSWKIDRRGVLRAWRDGVLVTALPAVESNWIIESAEHIGVVTLDLSEPGADDEEPASADAAGSDPHKGYL